MCCNKQLTGDKNKSISLLSESMFHKYIRSNRMQILTTTCVLFPGMYLLVITLSLKRYI